MTVPEPSVCPTCGGGGWVCGPDHDPESPSWRDEVPCPGCTCVCGGPYGHRCELLDDILEDCRMVRREDR